MNPRAPSVRRTLSTAAVAVSFALAFALLGTTACEDQADPRSALGPAAPTTYTAPPVHLPGTAATPPAPTTDLVVPVLAPTTPCSSPLDVPLASSGPTSLGVSDTAAIISGGQATILGAFQGGCPAGARFPFDIPDVGALRVLDGRGLAVVAGEAAVSAARDSGDRVLCPVARARAVGRVPGTETAYAVTGSPSLFHLDWSGPTCEITELALPDVALTLSVASSSSGTWVATAEREGAAVFARVRRFDFDKGAFDELSPVLGGQPGTLCSVDALAVSDDGDRVAVLDGTCGRVVLFRGSDGALLSGVSLRARAIAPVAGARAFLLLTGDAAGSGFVQVAGD